MALKLLSASSRYSRATISIDKALKIASSCIRLKFARGNASVLASSLAEIRQRPASFIRIVAVLLLQGYCHYQRKELDNATGFFQLILFQSRGNLRQIIKRRSH